MYQSKKPYLYGTGRRKSSVARVQVFPGGSGSITVNGRDIEEYFGLDTLKMIVRQPLVATANEGKVDIVATVKGGGVSGQAGALRHGIAQKNNADILLALEADYRALCARNLTLSRLGEAVILPLCPDKGGCMSYDLNRSASTYLDNDIEMLKRLQANFKIVIG